MPLAPVSDSDANTRTEDGGKPSPSAKPAEESAAPETPVSEQPTPAVARPPPAIEVPPERSSQDETVLFVDWDDTLLCTHDMIERQGIDIDRQRNPVMPAPVLSQLRKLQNDCIGLLEACDSLGRLVLVTNAAPGWIERSGALCLPKLLQWIQRREIEVVYARQTVPPAQAADPTQWKPTAFSIALAELRSQLSDGTDESEEEPRINIVSIGDGIYERVAARVAAAPQDLVKTLKFVDSPSIAQLRQQLKLATQMLPEVVGSGAHAYAFDRTACAHNCGC